MNNKSLEIIINLLIGIKNGNQIVDEYGVDQPIKIENCKYLLGQVIRQLYLGEDKLFVTEKALEKWNKITDESIFKYCYRNNIVKTKDDYVEIDKYIGSSKKLFKTDILLKGDRFIYNDVFIDEHIVPVSDIIKALLGLENFNDYQSVSKILDNICICKMLKEESFNIKTYNRDSLDYRCVIKNHYEPNGIRIVNYKQ